MEPNAEKLDEIILALLYCNSWVEKPNSKLKMVRAWKSLDWDSLERLHERGLIADPKGRAKSVVITEEGNELAAKMFEKYLV